MSQNQMEDMFARLWLAEIAVAIIGTMVTMYLLYLVIRWGVRDGMKEAMREQRSNRTFKTEKPLLDKDFSATR
jgi:hypothetical protein